MTTMEQAPGAVRVARLWEAATGADATPARAGSCIDARDCWPGGVVIGTNPGTG